MAVKARCDSRVGHVNLGLGDGEEATGGCFSGDELLHLGASGAETWSGSGAEGTMQVLMLLVLVFCYCWGSCRAEGNRREVLFTKCCSV